MRRLLFLLCLPLAAQVSPPATITATVTSTAPGHPVSTRSGLITPENTSLISILGGGTCSAN